MKMGTGNPIVDEMAGFDFDCEVSVVPVTWYKKITYPSGKPYFIAAIILSDIVDRYRPLEVIDGQTGDVVGYGKRFEGDLLQWSYADISEQFGITKREARAATSSLEDLGVIRKHFRTVTSEDSKLPNVLFIELVPDKLFELTCH